jgi:hypothetical protein
LKIISIYKKASRSWQLLETVKDRALGRIALRMRTRAGFGFETSLFGVAAVIAAIDVAAFDWSAHRAVTDVVTALERTFTHTLVLEWR